MPGKPLFSSRMRLVDVPLLRGEMRLYPDRLCLEGRTYALRPYRRTLALEQIRQVDWTTTSEPYNLTLVLAGEAVHLDVPEPATWKFSIEAAFPNVGRPPVGLPCLASDVRERLLADVRLPATSRLPERPAVAPALAAPQEDLKDLFGALEGARIASVRVPGEGELVLVLRLAGHHRAATVAEGLLALRQQTHVDSPRA